MWSLDLSEGIDFSVCWAIRRSTAITLEKLVKPGDVVLDIGANIGAYTWDWRAASGPQEECSCLSPPLRSTN
jgi:hypothetical protein